MKHTATIARNNLIAANRHLAKEWHPTKNGNLTPRDVKPHSSKKVWWRCSKGHEWQAVVYSRTDGNGCPYCSGKSVCNDNCLQTINPALSKKWHPTKNNKLTPKDLTPNSDKKVWWQCSKGHEWQAQVGNRNKGIGCPYCSGRYACKENCLQTVNPVLAKEWHPTKNGNLTPRNVKPFSSKKVWWWCKKDHEWQAVIASRSYGNKCPYCSGRAIRKNNRLRRLNPVLVKPVLVKEWHPTKNKNLTPRDVKSGSAKKVWWQCSKGHEWWATVCSRSNGSGCPYCSGKSVCDDNCLQTIKPGLAKEWHPMRLSSVRRTPQNAHSSPWKISTYDLTQGNRI